MQFTSNAYREDSKYSYGKGNNLLLFGDNLPALQALQKDFREKVKCVCIDPPYNTCFQFEHFKDDLDHESWKKMMKERLVLMHSLLQEDGSIWIFIDDAELYNLKLLCDEIFGERNFQANIPWSHDITFWEGYKGQFLYYHNYILVYSKSEKFRLKSRSDTGRKPESVWNEKDYGGVIEAIHESTELFGKDNPFSTPKPELVIYRILDVATDQGDIVLDAFGGSGTTGAVAHKMGRPWIMIEKEVQRETYIIPRMRKVIEGVDQGGISRRVGWNGGGGFRSFLPN